MEYFGQEVIAVNAVKINYIKIIHRVNKNRLFNIFLNMSIFACTFVVCIFVFNILKNYI